MATLLEVRTVPATRPEDELVARARAGLNDAREELFRRHRDVAFRVAHRLLGHHEDALDAVQDAFLKAFRSLNEFDGRSGFRTWLLRIVHNAALDAGRRRQRRREFRLIDGDDESGEGSQTVDPGATADPSLGLRRDDLRRVLDGALNQLSPTLRTTFVLNQEAGLSYQEISDVLDVPIGTVMSRIHAARRKLQSILGENDLEW